MQFTDFGRKLTSRSGILLLMDDLGKPLPEGVKPLPLGGGNPARIEAVEKAYRAEMEKLLSSPDGFEDVISHYDSPQGRMSFISAVTEFLNRKFGWNLEEGNIAITNGSQSAMFYLFNLLSGRSGGRVRKILFPVMPEYVGYADQGVEEGTFVGVPSIIESISEHVFKYKVDFEAVERCLEDEDINAIAVSRPTNPTGNVLTDDEIERLSELACRKDIPLIIDNAYGLPFPDIVFNDDCHITWNENIILSMSLSKIGLPSIRTGIIIARKDIAEALSNMNAIAALASGSMGQVLAEDLVRTGRIEELAREEVRPFYKAKADRAEALVNRYFEGTEYSYHRIEGSIFMWLCLPRLSMPSIDFYSLIKKDGVVTVPGEYFFYGLGEDSKKHPHYSRCLRLNYSGPDDVVEEGIRIISQRYRECYEGSGL